MVFVKEEQTDRIHINKHTDRQTVRQGDGETERQAQTNQTKPDKTRPRPNPKQSKPAQSRVQARAGDATKPGQTKQAETDRQR